jgi:ketosteroid isomerase-like protein
MNNLETAKTIYDAFSRGDVGFILSQISPNVAWEKWADNHAQRADVPYLRELGSVEEVAGFFGEVAKLGVRFSNVIAMMSGGNRVAVEFEIETERFGFEQEMHLWTFDENGKVIGFRHYLDTAKHIAAHEKAMSARS